MTRDIYARELDIEQLIQELTLSEKISLLAGVDIWHTVPIEELGIPSIRTSDGPNGIRGTAHFSMVFHQLRFLVEQLWQPLLIRNC